MKRIITILSIILLFPGLFAQDVDQQVISSAGGYDVSGGGISLSWTLGELVTSTVTSGGGELILTQGFQQSKLTVDAIEINPELGATVLIYPNPSVDMVNIKFSSPLSGETVISMLGPDGRAVFNEVLQAGILTKQINMQGYPGGTYFLRIQNANKLNVYKVIKL